MVGIKALYEKLDVFVCTNTGSGKSLIYESYPVICPGSCVLVIAPLVSIMTEQCERLSKLGFSATYIDKDEREKDDIINCQYDFLFGSPESLLGDWRDMLKSQVWRDKLNLIVVDEAHTVLQ